MPLRPALSASAIALMTASAQAGSLSVPSRIDTVSVHPDGARVNRHVEVDLPKGPTTIVVEGMPLPSPSPA